MWDLLRACRDGVMGRGGGAKVGVRLRLSTTNSYLGCMESFRCGHPGCRAQGAQRSAADAENDTVFGDSNRGKAVALKTAPTSDRVLLVLLQARRQRGPLCMADDCPLRLESTELGGRGTQARNVGNGGYLQPRLQAVKAASRASQSSSSHPKALRP